MITKPKRHQSRKLKESARGQECLIRSPFCNYNPETTVLCHMNGGGMGTKKSDIHAAFGCSACHDFVDGRTNHSYSPVFVKELFLDGVERTQDWWLDNGYLNIKGAK